MGAVLVGRIMRQCIYSPSTELLASNPELVLQDAEQLVRDAEDQLSTGGAGEDRSKRKREAAWAYSWEVDKQDQVSTKVRHCPPPLPLPPPLAFPGLHPTMNVVLQRAAVLWLLQQWDCTALDAAALLHHFESHVHSIYMSLSLSSPRPSFLAIGPFCT